MSDSNPIPRFLQPYVDEAISAGLTDPAAIMQHAHQRVMDVCEGLFARPEVMNVICTRMADVVYRRLRAERAIDGMYDVCDSPKASV